MQLTDFTAAHFNRAMALYVAIAYPNAEARATVEAKFPPMDESSPLGAQLGRLVNESAGRTDGAKLARYTMRLGNSRYPHMKLVLEEYLQPGDYYLLVDSHDALPGVADEDQGLYLSITRHNRRIRVAIEHAWDREGLPTIHVLHDRLRESRRVRQETARLTGVTEEPETVASGRASGRTPATGPLAPLASASDLADLTAASGGPAAPMILVVDDEDHLGGCTAEILRAAGYRVTRASDGHQAVIRTQVLPPDLIVCDIDMPEVDGREACNAWRSREATAAIPIVILTSSQISDDNRPDSDVVLQKPLDAAALVATVERLLEARRVSP